MAKPRQVKLEQKSALGAMQQLESRSDEELAGETRYRAAAQAILGQRAGQRFDAKAARAHYQRAIASARPQERMQLRRMADASLALAERRADDLKEAVTRLGQEPPSSRQLFMLKLMGLLAPAEGVSLLLRIRGILLILLLIVALLAIGFGLAELISLPFGGIGVGAAIGLGIIIVAIALGVLAFFNRRRQAKMKADRAAAGAPAKR